MNLSPRMQGREQRLTIAIAKLQGRIEQSKQGWLSNLLPSPELTKMKSKLKELSLSLENIVRHGWEKPPNGLPIGADVGVPHAGDKT